MQDFFGFLVISKEDILKQKRPAYEKPDI